jgi:hypothetical protein
VFRRSYPETHKSSLLPRSLLLWYLFNIILHFTPIFQIISFFWCSDKNFIWVSLLPLIALQVYFFGDSVDIKSTILLFLEFGCDFRNRKRKIWCSATLSLCRRLFPPAFKVKFENWVWNLFCLLFFNFSLSVTADKMEQQIVSILLFTVVTCSYFKHSLQNILSCSKEI